MSVTPAGTGGDDQSGVWGAAVSGDGRFVAFESQASDLVVGDTDGSNDVFVRDRVTGTTERVSVNRAGRTADGESFQPSITGDGRFVVFSSEASDLVADDHNGDSDVFVRDRVTDETSRISLDSAGREASGDSWVDLNTVAISNDGRFVSFISEAQLVPEDLDRSTTDLYLRDRHAGTTTIIEGTKNAGFSGAISADGRYITFSSRFVPDFGGARHVFRVDRATGTITRVSVASDGTPANCPFSEPVCSFHSSISADGRYVLFRSAATNLVAGDTNNVPDYFVHDTLTATTTRVNVASDGSQANQRSDHASLSGDGRLVLFLSHATNLVPGDTNGRADVFLHDRATGLTTRESVDSAGAEANADSLWVAISADGTAAVFTSMAGNLTENEDTNQSPQPRHFHNSGWDVYAHELSAGP